MELHSDTIIVGGGLTGSLAALALADAGFSVTLIDADDPANMTGDNFDGRTTAIAYASARLLKKLGLWERMAPQAGAINDILVTDGRPAGRFRKGEVAPGFLHFDSRELGEGDAATPLGWIVENRLMRRVFFDAIAQHENITLIAPGLCKSMKAAAGHAEVSLTNGDTHRTRLVIGADGRRSPLREQAKIKTARWHYPQSGIVCTVAHEKDHLGIAQEVFLPAGPFAILPMTDNRSSLVWTENAKSADSYMALSDTPFLAEITKRFGSYLGELSLAGPRWSYPLGFHIASRFHADRLALIGDAAHGIHPIAGQGYNLGVKDIAALRDVLLETRQAGLDIGHGTPLAKYDRWRRFDSASLAFGTDALNRIMSIDNDLLRSARSAGMGLVNRIDPLRKIFMRQAGGDLGDLPSLMRP
ncbi:UbiH/UbiF/VisC/COQ6 family ubiquinone biosynthesis hydroxylase [Parvularcula sp. IMCC14364]|uniref:UbiH/UbiF/VisC/COQ6 family ubiquinone biosynthesis hydroxylase n=1 Tax=Parvularcula sp. IMCC14364 TaxID=3067902 RepID=UPI002741929D|nr:UbiH/UbiF/VisC/COQ6 family ubiquinone biosynthesis hydroxylase [Parvularcula sp. IMCC14364]